MKTSLVLDIGTHSLGGGLVRFSDDSSGLVYQNRQNYRGIGKRAMIGALTSVLRDISTTGVRSIAQTRFPGTLDHVVISYAPHWTKSNLSHRHFSSNEDFLFNHNFSSRVINEEVEKYHNEIKNIGEDPHQMLEHSLASLLVNGYRVPFSNHIRGNSLQMGIFLSSIPKDLHNMVEKRVMETVDTKRGGSVQSIFSIFKRVFSRSHDKGRTMVVMVGPNTSDTILIESGHINKFSSVPFGNMSILRKVKNVFGVDDYTAHSYISLFSKSKLDSSVSNKLDLLLLEIEKEWFESWDKEVLGGGSANLILFAPQDTELIWETLFKNLPDVSEVTHFNDPLPVIASYSQELLARN